MQRRRRGWMICLGTACLILAVICIVKLISGQWAAGDQTMDSLQTGEDLSGNRITWNGKSYTYNEHLSNFLFLGIDTEETVETETGHADAGQADALFLVSWDRVEGQITVISIPRDTMTDIQIYGIGGEDLGKSRDHISLSYAYGDGEEESCQLAEDAVSNLLYGIPIQGTCALNLQGIPILAEDIGGVAVTVPNDSLEETYPEFQEGSLVTIDGSNAEAFLRYRDVEVSQSALTRLERQEAFLEGFWTAAKESFAQNPEIVTQMYEDLKPYMVTSIGKDQFVKMMQSAAEGEGVQKWTLPGKAVEGTTFDEYEVDDSALYEQIIETFYQPGEDS